MSSNRAATRIWSHTCASAAASSRVNGLSLSPRELAPEERLQFRPGELPPPFDPDTAPKLPAADWPPERLTMAERNYAMEYIRSGLPRLAEL